MTRPRQIQPFVLEVSSVPAKEKNRADDGAIDRTEIESRNEGFTSFVDMQITPTHARATQRGNPDYFTGSVWLDEIAGADSPGRLRSFRVTFEPGARTAWHTHPHGQVLHVLSGVGRVQTAGEPVRTITAGDTVWFAPGELHWHGAAPGHAMVHVAMQMADESGSHSTWFQQVTETEYAGS